MAATAQKKDTGKVSQTMGNPAKKTTAKKTNSGKATNKTASANKTKTQKTQKPKNSTAGQKKTKTQSRQKTESRSKTQSKSKAQSAAAEQTQAYKTPKNTQMRDEILLVAALAVCLFALLGNAGLGGFLGEKISVALFGSFGAFAYVMPLFVFFLMAFLISNRKNKIVWLKLFAVVLMMLVICGALELMMNGYLKETTLSDYYYGSAENKNGGGAVGGFLLFVCCPALGVAGTYVILIALFLIAVVLLTEKSLFSGVEKGSAKLYHVARENAARQGEIWKERIREQRLEREAQREEEEEEWLLEEEEQSYHGVANIVIDDRENTPRMEEPQEDWLEREAWQQESEQRKKKEQAAQSEWAEEYEEEQREEQTQVEEECHQKNFWEKNETEQEEPIAVEVEEVDLMDEGQEMPQMPSVEEIFTPQCRVQEREQMYEEADQDTFEEAAAFDEENVLEEHGEHRRVSETEAEEEIAQVREEIEEEEREPRREYEFPPLELLSQPQSNRKSQNLQELKETGMKLQQTLHSFGVNVNVIDASCGPSVTRYELQPEQGVKVSRIVNLADDIKLNLAAEDIRIEAPIPGKAAVGIEVPNKENSTVFLRELLESPEFQNHPSNLAFAAGKDIGGKVVVADIAKMPHLLIAGATGSGKSVCINTIIISLLYKAKPEDVKLIMIDPKVVELSVYNGIPHLMVPVVTDPKKAAGALNWAVAEMTERYNRFAVMGVRDLKGYNQKVAAIENINEENKPQKMPQIVIIVDELADLMMVAQNDVEDSICRLAQLARAAGIHLIIATQRPSVNVITGVIKANMPSRIAFSVSSGVDSRTIIDMNGAEKLLGKGDMLFFPQGLPKPARVQGAFVSDKEVSDVVEFLSAQKLPCDTKAIEDKMKQAQSAGVGQGASSEWDPCFEQAGKIVIEKEKASIGMLQRGLKVGFNRAARIMEQLYEAGVVGEEEGTKPRKVLMSLEEFEQFVDEYI